MKERTWFDDFQDIVNNKYEHLKPKATDSEADKAWKEVIYNMLKELEKHVPERKTEEDNK